VYAWNLGLYQGMTVATRQRRVIRRHPELSHSGRRSLQHRYKPQNRVERSVAEHNPGLGFGDLRKINTSEGTMSALGQKPT